MAPQTRFELATFWLTGNSRASVVRLSAFARVILDGMGLELAGQETPPVKPAASGNEALGGAGRANSGVARQPALRFVAHVGNHLREYDFHVRERWIGDVAPAADQVVVGVQVRIVRAKVVKAGETSKDSIDGRHVWAPTANRAWVGGGESKLVITSRSSGYDRVAPLTIVALGGDNGEM